jgi:geranylgeranylglycerol-phosphate geranylgeranyltransferase
MRYLATVSSLIRWQNCLITMFVVIIAVMLLPFLPEIKQIIIAAVAAALITAYGNIHNDIADFNADKVNHPGRPLPSGRLGIRSAIVWLQICLAFGLILSLLLNSHCFAIAAASSVALFLYSLFIKRIPLMANIWVALIAALTFVYAGYLSPFYAISRFNLINAGVLMAIFFHLGRELVKDLQDMEGDRKAGLSTVALIWSEAAAKLIVTFSFAMVGILGILICLFLKPGLEFMVTFLIGIIMPVIVLVVIIWRRSDKNTYKTISAWLKILMPMGMLTLLLARQKLPLDSL